MKFLNQYFCHLFLWFIALVNVGFFLAQMHETAGGVPFARWMLLLNAGIIVLLSRAIMKREADQNA